jgi:hypothetical protein
MERTHNRLVKQAAHRLADLLEVNSDELRLRQEPIEGEKGGRPDLSVINGKTRFILECKSSGEAASVAGAVRQLRESAPAAREKAVLLVVAPYMGEVGRRICEKEGVSWFDLSGNASIRAPGLRIEIEGKPNKFKRLGRPKNLFAPKSARITRWFLMQKDESFSQRELARLSELDEGFTSRIVRGLEEQGLVTRAPDGQVSVLDYDALLDAWLEAYEFSKHKISRGHIASRSSDEVLKRISGSTEEGSYAVTGLAGAWFYSGFAGFRIVAVYVKKMPSAEWKRKVGFLDSERGENVWLIQPDDDGVFQGSRIVDGVRCVHPVQVYLDLKNHPERSKDAAAELRTKLLTPASDD